MQNFEYRTPTKLIFGKGVIEKLPETLRPLGKRVLLTYGGGSIKRNGLYDKVKELLSDGFEVYELSGIEPNPKFDPSVLEGVKICRDKDIDVILSVGGGSVLDCSKAIAGCARTDGDPWDVITARIPTTGTVPIVDVMTMAATGSEYDPFGVISRAETNDKVAYKDPINFPVASFVDPTYTFSLPPLQTAAGVADAMNHVMESYFNSDPNDLADGMMEASMRSLRKNGPVAVREPDNYDARAEISLNASLDCNGILCLGEKPSGWPMHAMEHALSGFHDITHGVGLAILAPRWMRHVLSDRTEGRFAKYGATVFGIDPSLPDREIAEKAIDETYRLYEEMGIPMHLKDVGIDEDSLPAMARHVAENEGLDQPWVWVPLTEKDILEIYRASM